MRVGAFLIGDGKCVFRVWAPSARVMALRLLTGPERTVELSRRESGYWEGTVNGIGPVTLYRFVIDQTLERPDPASSFQPLGVAGPSQVVDHAAFEWGDDDWQGVKLSGMIMYELHVGTFTREGTLDAVIPRLGELRKLGVNAVELMPLAQFSGERNWGYDGAYPYAVHNTYGGPESLKRLVNSAHRQGLAVILDTVYNHMECEGNCLADFGPYFSKKHRTMWGRSLNFDGERSEGVRDFFLENALFWFREYHIDALRLDAADALFDDSPRHFLEELSEKTEAYSRKAGRRLYLIAETDSNDPKMIRPRSESGYGIDAQWCDDFHHALHGSLTGEKRGYYVDYGRLEQVVRGLNEAYVYQGEYSIFRKHPRGQSPGHRPASQFIVFSQNHDQVGNRLGGQRLLTYTSFEAAKLAAGVVLLSPFVPLLFMGEEYGDDSRFLFFMDDSDKYRIEAVRRGRKQTLECFGWDSVPADPKNIDTFLESKVKWELRSEGRHKTLLDYYRILIKLRTGIPALAVPDKENLEVREIVKDKVIHMRRWREEGQVICLMNFAKTAVASALDAPQGTWRKLLESSDIAWQGPGASLPESLEPGVILNIAPLSITIYERT